MNADGEQTDPMVPDAVSEETARELRRLGWKLALARAALAWERLWPALWPAAGIGGAFLALALFDLLPGLPIWLHGGILALFAGALATALWRGARALALPGISAGQRRIENTTGLVHRPLTLLRDRLASGTDDPAARDLWRLHRLRTIEKIRGLRIGFPSPGLARRDPLALRGLLIVILVIGMTIAWGDGANRIARALAPGVGGVVKGPAVVDIWITPPAYTGIAPIFLTAGKERRNKGTPAPLLASAGGIAAVAVIKGPIAIPEGSTVLAQLSGGWGTPQIVIGTKETEFKPVAEGTFKLTATIDMAPNVKQIRVIQAGREIGAWPVFLVADQPPVVSFGEAPGGSARGALRIDLEGSDDYGFAEAKLIIRRARMGGEEVKEEIPGLTKPPADEGKKDNGAKAARTAAMLAKLNVVKILELPLPGANIKDLKETSYHDLTAHPWAGLEVQVQVVAKDAAGQHGVSDSVTITLPERRFRHPVARALVLLRKRLARDPESRDEVWEALANLGTIPGAYDGDTVVFLSIQIMARTLAGDHGFDAIADVQEMLWETALWLEDGKLSQAERRLREIQKKLMEALKNKAGNAEIQKLMRELERAMAQFMREMMKGLKNLPNWARPFDPNSRSMSAQDLQRMLDRARELALTGNLDAARQLLSMLREMLENLRSGRFAMGRGRGQGQSKAWRMLQELQDMMRRQQELMDQSHRQSRQGMGQRPSTKEGARQQGDLKKQLQDLLRRFGEMMGKVPKSLGDAELAMREALEALRKSRPGEAVGPQGKALENLRRGLGQMAQQFMRRFGRGRGRGRGRGMFGRRPGHIPFAYDPLGRQLPNAGMTSADDVDIPDETETQRAWEILQELRRRAGEVGRPDLEMDYLERLLRRF
ncbi:MAG: TIGR02302 family protein [Alphaproteobacteria bacterium]|nr:MAG: TIGR02302 family protein [Alphaproteobacteria bacterium]